MNDPKRLLDVTHDDGLKELLSAGKSELPTDAQIAALAAKLAVAGGLGGAGAAAAGGSSAAGAGAKAGAVASGAAKTLLALKITGAIVVASAIGGVAVMSTRTPVELPAPVGIVATTATTTATPTASSAIAAAPSASADDALRTNPSAWDPLPTLSASSSWKPKEIDPPEKPAPEKPEAEVRLLSRAHAVLASHPADALALAEEHARRFPNGMLTQEREMIAIESLTKLGKTAAASERATRFRARYPASTYLRRIDALLGD